MHPDLQTKLENLPDNPGVYQFFDEAGKYLYIGKAKNLKNRVRSYFQKGDHSVRIGLMVKKIHDLQLVITDSEIEALVLENNFIKQYKPRYNILLKDDKSFPYIRITNELFPRIFPTRRIIRDGSRYYGPYTEVRAMRSALRMITQVFRIRSCRLQIDEQSIEKKKFKVCLDYHIKKCDGPCEGLISSADYKKMADQVGKLLSGKTSDLIKELKQEMNAAAADLRFEFAAEIRDKIDKLETISEKQKIISNDEEDRDVIGVAFEGKDATCTIFNLRGGKLIGKKQLRLSISDDSTEADIYASVIKQFYAEMVEIPDEILLAAEPPETELILEWLRKKAEKKVTFHYPKRGDLSSLLKLCKENALLQLKDIQLQRMKKEGNLPYPVKALQRDLRLKHLPRKIECFDISNLQGTDTVASMVVFSDGKPKKSLYRKFIIRSTEGEPDDFASMFEVISRRYKRLKEEGGKLPDLIMVDGGKGQLSSAVQALNKLGYENYAIIGLAKRLEEVFFPGQSEPENIPKVSSGLKLLQQVRDEAHRFAITFHRERRSKRTFTSELNEIKGIGDVVASKLLTHFGSIRAIRTAGMDTLTPVVGEKRANLIVRYYNEHPELLAEDESEQPDETGLAELPSGE